LKEKLIKINDLNELKTFINENIKQKGASEKLPLNNNYYLNNL
jgi:hypothetical protein